MHTDWNPRSLPIGSTLDVDWLEHLTDVACVVRPDGRIAQASAAACRNLGYRRTDLVALHVWDIDADHPPEQWQDWWRAVNHGASLHAPTRLRHRDGQLLPVELHVDLVSIDDQPHGMVVFREIPQQGGQLQDDQLQDDQVQGDQVQGDELTTFEELQRMLEIGERMARIGHWSFDLASRKLHWSEQIFQSLKRDRTLGEPSLAEVLRYVHADDLPALKQAVIACSKDQRPFDLQLRIQRDDGSSGHVRIYGAAMADAEGTAARLIGLVQDISEQKALEQALRKSEADYRLLVEEQTDLVVKVDAAGRFLFVSPSYCRVFGKREDELLGQIFMPLVHEDDRASTEAAMAELHRPPHRCYLEQRALTVDGWRWLGWVDSAILDEQGRIEAIIGVGRDIHARKLAAQALIDTQRKLDLALESGVIGTYSTHFGIGEVVADERYLAQLGYRPGEVEVNVAWWLENSHPDDLAAFAEQSEQVMHGGLDDFTAEYRMRHRDGHWVWIQDHARIFERDADGVAVAGTGLHIDVTRRKEAELKLAYHAEHDPLTDLLNRRGMWRAIKHVHAQAVRSRLSHSIAILDLDLFKQVNDNYGHIAGDCLLKEVAMLLSRTVRTADWVGRWGGEEFLILMPDTNADQARGMIERLRREIAATSFQADGNRIQITMSAGIAACRFEMDSQDQLISRADTALYHAKRSGRNRVCCDDDCADSCGEINSAVDVLPHSPPDDSND